jgi:hypothetical protein
MIPMTEQEKDLMPSVIKVLDPITMAINKLSVDEFIQLIVALEKANEESISDE